MLSFFLYHLKYIFMDIYFIILLILIMFVMITTEVFFGFIQMESSAYFLLIYILCVYAERRISGPLPAIFSARGLLATAAVTYSASLPVLLTAAWRSPTLLVAPLLAALRRRPALLVASLIAVAPLLPVGVAAVAVFEALARARLITTMGRGALRMSTLHPVAKALLAAAFMAVYLTVGGAANISIRGLSQFAATSPPPMTPVQLAALALFLLASYGLIFGASLDTYLDSRLRIYHLLKGRPSAKPIVTFFWLLAVSLPVCLFKECDVFTHTAFIALWTASIWSLKPDIFRNEDAVALLLALFVAGYLSHYPQLLAAAALLPILPKLSEEIRHVLSSGQ
jgi:hypothetical protein